METTKTNCNKFFARFLLLVTVGTGTAMDRLLSARKFKGDEAKEMDIVQKVFPKETLVS